MLSTDEARTLTRAWNSHDVERIVSHYSEDVELVSPFVARLTGDPGGSVRGREALRAYVGKGLARFPDLRFTLYKSLPGVRSLVIYYRSVNNLLAAEVLELDAGGKICRVLAHYAEE